MVSIYIYPFPTLKRNYKSVNNGQYSDEIPPHQLFDYVIDMLKGKEPPWGPINALSEK